MISILAAIFLPVSPTCINNAKKKKKIRFLPEITTKLVRQNIQKFCGCVNLFLFENDSTETIIRIA